MGNQPNNLLQCGTTQRDMRQQVSNTRQQAIKANSLPTIFKKQNNEQKTTYLGNTKQNWIFPTIYDKSKSQTEKNKLQNNPNFIPQHENITKASKTPKDRFVRMLNSQYYQEPRGKCLDQIIEGRYNSTMHFPQYQVINLMESLIYSLAYMSKKNVNNHDFYPTNIYYNNEIFKILNPVLAKYSGYSLTQQSKRFSFLSPQLILEILNDRKQSEIQKQLMNKSDVFSIGMVLLQFCTLLPSSQCYDSETYSIIDSQIKQRMQKICQVYNPLIANCIDLMLRYQVDKRLSPIQLAYTLHSNLEAIRNQQAMEQSRIRLSANRLPPGTPQQILGAQTQGMPPQLLSTIGSGPQGISPQVLPPQGLPPQGLPQQGVPQQGIYQQGIASQGIYQQGLSSQGSPIQQAQLQQNQRMMLPPGFGINNSNPQIPLVSNNIPTSSPLNNSHQIHGSNNLIMISGPPGYTLPTNSTNLNNLNPIGVNQIKQGPTNFLNTGLEKNSNNISPSFKTDQFGKINELGGKNILPSQTKPNQMSGSKAKFNPFQQIVQDFKQDQDQSPIKKTTNLTKNTVPSLSNSTAPKSSNSESIVYPYNIPKNDKPLPKAANQVQTSSSTSYVYNNTAKKQESLDQRVKRILEASKNIK